MFIVASFYLMYWARIFIRSLDPWKIHCAGWDIDAGYCLHNLQEDTNKNGLSSAAPQSVSVSLFLLW